MEVAPLVDLDGQRTPCGVHGRKSTGARIDAPVSGIEEVEPGDPVAGSREREDGQQGVRRGGGLPGLSVVRWMGTERFVPAR